VYNNRGQYTPQDCEVDACNEHVGQGGGQPHLHGDPFHSTDGVCLYGPANYTSDSAHPPLWGFSLDGYNIYGRHLSANNEGYAPPWGGHICAGTCSHLRRILILEGTLGIHVCW
jgi:hypothetical protein